MAEFRIKLADISFEIFALFDKTEEIFRDYLTDALPQDTIEAAPERLEKEVELAVRTFGCGRPVSLEPVEPHWLYHQLGSRLPKHDALLVHGSAVALDGRAYLFCAPSGTGKSTHALAWKTWFGERARIINDDRPLIKITEDGIYVYGSPWMGKHRRGANISAPLEALCLLERAEKNSIVRLTGPEAFPGLIKQCYFIRKGIEPGLNAPGIPSEADYTEKLLAMLERLTKNVPLYRLGCNMEPDAAEAAYNGIRGTL